MRILDPQWFVLLTATSAQTVTEPNGDRFLVLGKGQRYDLQLGSPQARYAVFDSLGVRIESKDSAQSMSAARDRALNSRRARPTSLLLQDTEYDSWGQMMWRLAIPWAALNLAFLAIPLGAVNPRLGRSGDILIAGLVAMLYMNLINISQGWIIYGKLPFSIGVWLVHAAFGLMAGLLMWWRMRIKTPKPPVVTATDSAATS